MVLMTIEEYAAVRQDATTFLNVPGHEASSQGWAQVIETHDDYVVVAKVEPAGEVAEQLEREAGPATAPVDKDR